MLIHPPSLLVLSVRRQRAIYPPAKLRAGEESDALPS
jgi:hypothetical protein